MMKTLATITTCALAMIYGCSDDENARDIPSSEALVQSMLKGLPTDNARIFRLEGCQLSLREESVQDNPMAGGPSRVLVNSQFDLGVFDFDAATKVSGANGIIALGAKRIVGSERLYDQAERLVGILPENERDETNTLTMLPNGGGVNQLQMLSAEDQKNLTRDDYVRMMDTPRSTLNFRLIAVAVSKPGEEFKGVQPHEDAPEFNAFLDRAAGLQGPITFVSYRLYKGEVVNPANLLTGNLEIPLSFTLPVKSESDVQSLSEDIAAYKSVHCPS